MPDTVSGEVRDMGVLESAWWSFRKFFLGQSNATTTNPVTGAEETVEPIKIPIVGEFATGIGNVFKGVGDTFKQLPKMLLVAVVFIGIYLVLMGRKGRTVI